MHAVATVFGVVLLVVIAWDAFETMLLPRRVSRRLRISSTFLEGLWLGWSFVGRRLPRGRAESYLSLYALLGLLMLFAIWVSAVTVGYSLIDLGLGRAFTTTTGVSGFVADLYVSGTTIFTLGLGDVLPITGWSRFVTVIEGGTGLIFLALVNSYLPVLYQSFSRRELQIALLDEWARTPPTGVELLRRTARSGSLDDLGEFFREWEHWAADILESHVSFPILGYFRSQHDNQSWLAAMTAVLDAAALCMVGVAGVPLTPARRAFAMNRHAAVDLSQVLGSRPLLEDWASDRADGWSGVTLKDLQSLLGDAGIGIEPHEEHFSKLRRAYEPYLAALSVHLMMPMPPLLPTKEASDNWRTSQWEVIRTV